MSSAILLALPYIGTILGNLLGKICSEELIPLQKRIRLLEKATLSITVFLYTLIFFQTNFVIGILLGIILGGLLFKIKFSRQLLMFVWPFLLVSIIKRDESLIFLGLFLCYIIFTSSRILLPYVNKKDPYTITKSFIEIQKIIIKKTNLFFISYVLCLLILIL